jgi:hypothetical protein
MTGKGDDIKPFNSKKLDESFAKIFGKRITRATIHIFSELETDKNSQNLKKKTKENKYVG